MRLDMIQLFLLLAVQAADYFVRTCPVGPGSPCSCGIQNDSTSYIECSNLDLLDVPSFIRSYLTDHLFLSNNYISAINDHTFADLRVRRLHFKDNPVSNVSRGAFSHPSLLNHLEEVNLDTLKNVRTIPVGLSCQGVKLRSLRLKGLDLIRGDAGLCSNLTRLKHLSLVDCGLNGFLRGVPLDLQSLVELDLTNNSLVSFPYFPSLEVLSLSGNRLTELSRLSASLKFLDLSNNKLVSWPLQVCPLDNLEELNMASNQISSIHVSTSKCLGSLRYLDMHSNQLHGFLDRVGLSTHKFTLFRNLHVIDMSDNGLDKFDAKLLGEELKELVLAKNHLTMIPNDLPASIVYLDVSNNLICSVSPATVKFLTKLETFRIGENRLHCDCNLRPLQNEVMRRTNIAKSATTNATSHQYHMVKCFSPESLHDVVIADILDPTPCLSTVPSCVRIVHGENVQLAQNKSSKYGITDIFLRYIPQPRRSILVIWDWNDGDNKKQGSLNFRISFELHSQHKHDPNAITQHSTVLPPSARRFALQDVLSDRTYTVCVTSDHSDNKLQHRCAEITTDEIVLKDVLGPGAKEDAMHRAVGNYNDDVTVWKKSKTDINVIALLILLISLITLALFSVVILLVILVIRRIYRQRHPESCKQKKQRRKSEPDEAGEKLCNECCRSGLIHTCQIGTTDSASPLTTLVIPNKYCCSFCWECSQRSSDSGTTSSTLNKQHHVYHEINEQMKARCYHHDNSATARHFVVIDSNRSRQAANECTCTE